MIRIYVIKIVLFFFIFSNIQDIFSQELKKETVYLLFKKNDGNFSDALGKKFITNRGINLNLCKYYFLHKKNMKRDTLCLWHLKDYKITKESELKYLGKKWRTENEKELKKRFGGVWVIDRNAVFDINIIEKINDTQMVIYKAIFRNEGVID